MNESYWMTGYSAVESQLVITGLGVEKLDIAENQDNRDRKCPDDPRKSFIGHPDATQFLPIYDN
jgi:hypothetical protein